MATTLRIEALLIENRFRCGVAHFELGAHSLKTRCQGFDFLLLFRELRFQFLDFAVLFEELVEQHRVDLLVAHRVNLAFLVAHYQVGVHLGYFFGDQTKLRWAFLVVFVAKSHRFERQERFAGAVHRLDLLFEPPRRAQRAELADGVYHDWYRVGNCRCHPANVANKATVAHVFTGKESADADDVSGRGNIATGLSAQDRVVAAGRVKLKGIETVGRVAITGGVAIERVNTVGRVLGAAGVAIERPKTVGRVAVTGGVARERLITRGRIRPSSGVPKERSHARGCVLEAGGIGVERLMTVGRVTVAIGIIKERENAVGRVLAAGGVAKEGLHAGGCVSEADGVASERINASRRVEVAGCVGYKGIDTGGRILAASGVAKQGTESLCGVIVAGGVVIERLKTKSGVVDPAGQAKKRVCSLSRVGARIAAIRRRNNRSCHLAKCKTDQQKRQRDDKETAS